MESNGVKNEVLDDKMEEKVKEDLTENHDKQEAMETGTSDETKPVNEAKKRVKEEPKDSEVVRY